MKAIDPVYKLLCISPIFGYLSEKGSESFLQTDMEAVVFFVYSGELTISYQNEEIVLKEGEYAFVKRGIITDIIRKDIGKGTFNSIYMGLDKCFLWSIYKNVCSQSFCCCSENFEQNLIKLSYNPYLQSLYISLGTYLEYGVKPSTDMLQLKMLEAVYSLTLTDKRFFTCLFDFIHPFDYMNLLNNNLLNN